MLQNQKTPELPPKKTLSELADEYEANIPLLEKMLSDLKQEKLTAPNRRAVMDKISIVEDMILETRFVVRDMRSYYDKD